MGNPALKKLSLWRGRQQGARSRFNDNLKPPVESREDILSSRLDEMMEEADFGQRKRLSRIPSIDVSREDLYAGTMPVSKKRAKELLKDMGFRSKPTAYVEVVDGTPDGGAYARNRVVELERRVDIPQLFGVVSPINRVKDQLTITLFSDGESTDVLAHRVQYPMGQPTISVSREGEVAKHGVRQFRSLVQQELGRELPGEGDVKW